MPTWPGLEWPVSALHPGTGRGGSLAPAQGTGAVQCIARLTLGSGHCGQSALDAVLLLHGGTSLWLCFSTSLWTLCSVCVRRGSERPLGTSPSTCCPVSLLLKSPRASYTLWGVVWSGPGPVGLTAFLSLLHNMNISLCQLRKVPFGPPCLGFLF